MCDELYFEDDDTFSYLANLHGVQFVATRTSKAPKVSQIDNGLMIVTRRGYRTEERDQVCKCH